MSDPEYNRLSLLKALRLAEPVSRTDLARMTGLNGGTVTAVVRDLVDRGLLVEERVASAGMGRPKLNLRIDPDGAFVVGATLTTDGRLIAELVNLRGETILTGGEPVRPATRLDALAAQFAEVVTKLVQQAAIPNRIAQIGIGLPAMVDHPGGTVEFLETFEDAPFAFAAHVEALTGIRTRIDNNINLLARAEHWFGDGAGTEDFSIVLFDLGLGAASYQAGQLHLGRHGIEAELGHMKIVPDGGRPCQCGALGCLQAYSSVSGIVEQYCEIAGERPPGIFELQSRCDELAARARAGDGDILALFVRAGHYLGTGIANHVNMQGPDRIVILFPDANLQSLIEGPLLERMRRDVLPILYDRIDLRFGIMEERRYARGAAAMVLESLFRS